MRVFHSAGKRIYFTLLASSFMFPISAFAQCVDTQDCAALGYTDAKDTGNCLKCPFGNTWACAGEQCDESYKYACINSNEQPGTDECGGKYKSCNCASGYEWNGTSCSKQCEPYPDETDCFLGVESCDDGCGGSRYCCIYSKKKTISQGCSCQYDSGMMHCDRVYVSTQTTTTYYDGRTETSTNGFWLSGCQENCNANDYSSTFQCWIGHEI